MNMNPAIKYFSGERFQCTIGIALGVISIAVALYFLFQVHKPFFTGIAYPFIVISILLLIVCIGVVVRSPKDIARVNHMLQNDLTKITTEEIPRMEKVLKSFRVIIIVEIVFIVLGIASLFFTPAASLWRGIGMALLIQGTLLLAFDIIAERRGKIYIETLQTINHI